MEIGFVAVVLHQRPKCIPVRISLHLFVAVATLGAECLHELPLQAPTYSHPHFPYLLPGSSDVCVGGCYETALQLQHCQTDGKD
jgi:hypothetical protein